MAESALCGRVGCGEPAACVLLMAAQEREAWLVGPDHEFALDGVCLCVVHADRITVPLGWSLTDERPPTKPRRQRKRKPKASAVSPEAVEPSEAGAADATSKESRAEPAPETDAASIDQEASAELAAPSDATAPSTTSPDDAGADEPAVDTSSAGSTASDEPAAAEVGVEPTSTTDQPIDTTVSADARIPSAKEETEADALSDDPTVQLPAVRLDHPSSPAEVPVNADAAAVAVDDDGPRLSVVPGEDDPNKTFDFEDDGQGALWAPAAEDAPEPDDRTPLLKRAFRVVRDD